MIEPKKKPNTIIIPAAGRVVVREIKGSDVTAAGIFLINDTRREGHMAKVVAVSPGWKDSHGNEFDSDFSPGDVIVFGKYVGTDLEVDNIKFIVLMEKDIMCTLIEASPDVPAEAVPA